MQTPVPRERPVVETEEVNGNGKREDAWLNRVHRIYSSIPGLRQIRHSKLLSELGNRLITEAKRVRGHHPYPDILSADTPGWKLMSAILTAFAREAKPIPVLVVPVPTRDFYMIGMEPVYQPPF